MLFSLSLSFSLSWLVYFVIHSHWLAVLSRTNSNNRRPRVYKNNWPVPVTTRTAPNNKRTVPLIATDAPPLPFCGESGAPGSHRPAAPRDTPPHANDTYGAMALCTGMHVCATAPTATSAEHAAEAPPTHHASVNKYSSAGACGALRGARLPAGAGPELGGDVGSI